MSDITDRIKYIRKSKKLNQTDFGTALNLKQSTIASYECGARPLTDRVISDICSTFNINEQWLRTGEGDPTPELNEYEEIESFVNRVLADRSDETRKRLLLALARLDVDGWIALATIAEQLAGK